MKNRSQMTGFTLLELSVTLVIVALLAAGILVGRDLIRSAEVRAQISQIEAVNTAVQTFQTRYNCLPGDCKHAVRLQLGTNGGAGDDGDGNDRIDVLHYVDGMGVPRISWTAPEMLNFWYHLMRANLLEGDYPGYTSQSNTKPGVDTPPTKLQGWGRIEPWYNDGYNNSPGGLCIMDPMQIDWGTPIFETSPWHAIALASRCDIFPNTIYKASDAYALDSKVDDGKPYTGTVRGYMYSLLLWDSPMIILAGDPYLCIKDDNYNLASTDLDPDDPFGTMLTLHCGMIFQTSF
jgi:prepilin-type N-terminal cleavage/methylation domain-containing protein